MTAKITLLSDDGKKIAEKEIQPTDIRDGLWSRTYKFAFAYSDYLPERKAANEWESKQRKENENDT